MKVSVVSQYSVFLLNEPNALKKFAEILSNHGINIIALSSEVRYEAAVVKFIVTSEREIIDTSRLISQSGYTSVRTDALCIEVKSVPGILMKLGDLLGKHNINITTIYGSGVASQPGKILIVVDDLEKALQVLNDAQDEL